MEVRLPIQGVLVALVLAGCGGKGPVEKPPPAGDRGIVGKWRTLSVVDPKKFGPVASEMEFRADGSLHERSNQGFNLVRECNGEYRIQGGTLLVKAEWADEFTDYSFEIAGDRLTLTRLSREEWCHVLERSAEPHPALADLPRQPRSVNEAVQTLRRILPAESLERIRRMEEGDVIGMHFGLGMYIRNGFGLWAGNRELLVSCGGEHMHPDNASTVILKALWKSLRELVGSHPMDGAARVGPQDASCSG